MPMQSEKENILNFNIYLKEQIRILEGNMKRASKRKSKELIESIVSNIGFRYRMNRKTDSIGQNQYIIKRDILKTIHASKCKLPQSTYLPLIILSFQRGGSRIDAEQSDVQQQTCKNDTQQTQLF